MDYQQMIRDMSPEIYESMKRALELGRWPDGRAVTPEQRESSMQAVIAWGEMHLSPEERVGYVKPKPKKGGASESPEETPLSWQNQE